MEETFSIDGAMKKLWAAKQIAKTFRELHRDAISFFQVKLSDEILNLSSEDEAGHAKGRSFIRRITGILVASIQRNLRAIDESTLTFNSAIAPYVFKVFDFAKERYGQTPIQLVLFFYADYVTKKMRETIFEAFRAVNKGEDYKYYYPF